jgi:hypothetical protein
VFEDLSFTSSCSKWASWRHWRSVINEVSVSFIGSAFLASSPLHNNSTYVYIYLKHTLIIFERGCMHHDTRTIDSIYSTHMYMYIYLSDIRVNHLPQSRAALHSHSSPFSLFLQDQFGSLQTPLPRYLPNSSVLW